MKNRLYYISVILLFLPFVGCEEEKQSRLPQKLNKSEAELKTLSLDDYKIHYLDIGEGEPVVFVHGTLGDYRVWETQLDTFALDHRVIALSRRYAYPNDQSLNDLNDYSIPAHAKDLVRFLEKIEVGPVHLVGHSYGAFTSLMASLARPDLIKSLTLGEPPVNSLLDSLPEAERLRALFISNVIIPAARSFNVGNDERAVALFIGGVLGDSLYYQNAPQKQKDRMMDNTPELKAITSGAAVSPKLYCQDFKSLNVPVLLIKGDRSPRNLRLIIDQLHNCIERSKLVELQNSSHGLEYENPKDFNRIVLEFIESNRSSGEE